MLFPSLSIYHMLFTFIIFEDLISYEYMGILSYDSKIIVVYLVFVNYKEMSDLHVVNLRTPKIN